MQEDELPLTESQRDPLPTGPDPETSARFVRIGLIFYGAMAAAAVLWRIGWHAEPLLFIDPAAAARGISPLRDAGLGLLAGAGVLLLSHWTTRRTRWGEQLARALAGSIGALSVPDALLLAMASGLAEELLFRGALQPRVGLVVASLLFGALHFVPRREFLPWTVFAIAAGFLFGALFLYTGNLLAPVLAHTVINGVNLPLLVRDYGTKGTKDAVDGAD